MRIQQSSLKRYYQINTIDLESENEDDRIGKENENVDLRFQYASTGTSEGREIGMIEGLLKIYLGMPESRE